MLPALFICTCTYFIYLIVLENRNMESIFLLHFILRSLYQLHILWGKKVVKAFYFFLETTFFQIA